MKKQLAFLLSLLFCLGLLSGCFVLRYHADSGFDIQAGTDNLKKTQRIEISNAATGQVLAVFHGEKEIEQFLGVLDEYQWKIRDLTDTPEDTERECAITMYQTETIKAGMDPADAEMMQLCTMYTYCGSNCLTMVFPFASFSFTLSDSTADYLHSFAS